MIHLVTGGSASGKSAYAESLAVDGGAGVRYYVATMRPWGEEGRQRVEMHRDMRREKQFVTVECYRDLEDLSLPGPVCRSKGPDSESMLPDCTVLLECLSNLVANEQFETGGSDEEICARIEKGIRHLQKQAGNLIIVTNEVFSDSCRYEPETVRYISLMGQINASLAAMADRVTEVVFGIPVPIKREG